MQGVEAKRRRRLVVIGGVAAGMSAASRAKRVDPQLEVIVLEKGPYISYGACSLPYFVAGHFDDYRTLIARTPEEAARHGVDVRLGHEAVAIDVGAGTVAVRVREGDAIREADPIAFDVLVIATGAEAIVPQAWGLGEMSGAFLLRSIDDARALRWWLGAPDLDAQREGAGTARVSESGAGRDFESDTARGSESGTERDSESGTERGSDSGGEPGPEQGGRAGSGPVAPLPKPKRAVVIGGGYIGVEAVDALLEQGIAVSLVDMAPQLLTNFDEDMASYIEEDLRAAGVDLHLGDAVEAVKSREGRFVGVELTSGTFIEADMAIVALGVRPNVDLARRAGIRIGETGAIAVDDRQRTNFPHIFAAGDCAEAHHIVTGRPAHVPLGTTANKQGRVAGTVIGGGDERFPGIVGTAVLKARNMSLARSGLTEREARNLGFDAVAAKITAPDRVHSYPGAREVTVKLVAEKGTGRLLGGQVVGAEPLAVSGRIDVVAAAVTTGMTLDEFGHLDLSYAPPFAPVWDPLLVAANVLQRHI